MISVIITFLSLELVCSQSSSLMSYESKSTDMRTGHVQCSNNSACPTWFICDIEKESVTVEIATTMLLSVMRKNLFLLFLTVTV